MVEHPVYVTHQIGKYLVINGCSTEPSAAKNNFFWQITKHINLIAVNEGTIRQLGGAKFYFAGAPKCLAAALNFVVVMVCLFFFQLIEK